MTTRRYIFARLRHDPRSTMALGLGVFVGSAVLTGALLVGDSMRASLRDRALARLGGVEYALTAVRFFSPELGNVRRYDPNIKRDAPGMVEPVILLNAAVIHADTRARISRVQVFGVTEGFWSLEAKRTADAASNETAAGSLPSGMGRLSESEDHCFVNRTLATQIGAASGEELLLSFVKPSEAPLESLLGRRDDSLATLRVKIAGILPDGSLGDLSLRPTRIQPCNVFVPLERLQRALRREGRVNLVLYGGSETSSSRRPLFPPDLSDLQERKTLADLGLSLRVSDEHGYVAVESGQWLLEPASEALVFAVTKQMACPSSSVFAYLANEMRVASGASVPYSIVAGLAADATWWDRVRDVAGAAVTPPADDDILINEWTARRLGAGVGDEVTLKYFVSRGVTGLQEAEARFRISAILPMEGPTQDPGFTPTYEGITDARRLNDWDPPFPFDAKRIGPDDEAYWDRYRAAPKAFIDLKRAQQFWTEASPSQGRLTSVRLFPPAGQTCEQLRGRLERNLLGDADLTAFGFALEPVLERALAASRGTTDFSGLFLGFSSFLIVSACVLVGLLFKLGIERRAKEIGLLQAVGLPPGRVRALLLGEGVIVAFLAALAAAPAAIGYAWLLIEGLHTRWSAATQAPFLTLHVSMLSVIIGTAGAVGIAALSMAWGLRGLAGLSTWRLAGGAAGLESSFNGRAHRGRGFMVTAGGLLLIGATTAFMNGSSQQAALWFFGGGASVLGGGLCLVYVWLRNTSRRGIVRAGRLAMVRLGVGGARRHPSRSLLTMTLIALAMFLIASLSVFRLDVAADLRRDGGTGGFSLLAETSLPLPFDLSEEQGRLSLGMSPAAVDRLRDVNVLPFRLRVGDSTSCLGLYAPARPRILGATPRAIARGGFSFAAIGDETSQARANPWTLLDRTFDDGAIAVIGDEAAVRWQLHSGLGRDFVIEDEAGKPVTLRFVALLRRSVLQDELIVSEAAFRRLFPSRAGHGFFLIEAPPQREALVAADLERELAPFGLDVTPTRKRLAEYLAVQNTYLETFQLLGGFGLMLGAAGLAVVMLRNVVERRAELGLMEAMGMPARSLMMYLWSEGALLVAAGLMIGLLGAATAVGPFVVADPARVPWRLVGLCILGTLVVGIGACRAALAVTLRGPLVSAIRRE